MSFTNTRPRRPEWLPWVVASHFLLIVGGLLSQAWLMLPLCLWTPSHVLQLPGALLWLALSVSPFLGLFAFKFPAVRKPYLALAIATPAFAAVVWSLNALEVTMCDAL